MASKLQLPRGSNSSSLPNYQDSSFPPGLPQPCPPGPANKASYLSGTQNKGSRLSLLPITHRVQEDPGCSCFVLWARTVRAQESRVER